MTGKIDPVEKVEKKKQEENLEKDIKTLDISEISIADFQQIPEQAARRASPFEGYALKPPIKIGEVEFSRTFIVGLNPMVYVAHDPSGDKVTVFDKRKKKDVIVNYQTVHSRMVPDWEQGGQNTDVVFDRELQLKDGKVKVAIVPSGAVRSMLVLKLTRDGAARVNKRYVLLDTDQWKRLRRWFQMITQPKRKAERDAAAIMGESQETLDDIKE